MTTRRLLSSGSTRRGEAGGLNSAVLDNGGCGYSRKATSWAITEEPYRGELATHAYEKWEPDPITAALWLQEKAWTKKQVHASTSGTMTVPPVELCNPDCSTSGTMEAAFEAPDSSTSGIPISTICKEPPSALPSAAPDGEKRPWRKPTILEEQDRSLHDFGTWMRDERERLGLSLEEVGQQIRMKAESVARFEDNRAMTTPAQRRNLRAYFKRAHLRLVS